MFIFDFRKAYETFGGEEFARWMGGEPRMPKQTLPVVNAQVPTLTEQVPDL